jgi:hypothetical protein
MKDTKTRKQTISVSLSGDDCDRLESMCNRLNSLGGDYTRSSLIREIIAFFVSKNGMKLFETGVETSLDMFRDLIPQETGKGA